LIDEGNKNDALEGATWRIVNNGARKNVQGRGYGDEIEIGDLIEKTQRNRRRGNRFASEEGIVRVQGRRRGKGGGNNGNDVAQEDPTKENRMQRLESLWIG